MTSPSSQLTDRNAPPVIERVPWSELGPEFIAQWGQPRGKVMPEHLEVLGPTGCGKSFLLTDMLRERVRRRGSSCIFVATKQADKTIDELGWEVTDTWHGVSREDQVVYWPRTKLLGRERKAHQAAKIEDLLGRLWQPEANTVLVLDEYVWIENLSAELKEMLLMYMREGRSHGLTVVGGKQRVQGVARDFHSETDWKCAFQMNDLDDNERLAQLFGSKRAYVPVIEGLSRERHEFLIQHKLTGTQYISWVDKPMAPPPSRPASSGYRKT